MSTNLTVIGNLAADPELRFTQQGKAVASFTVITSKSRKTDNGTWESSDVTSWHVVAWDALGENAAQSLTKGTPVVVVGNAVWKAWESKDTTEKRGRLEITAWNIGVDIKRNPVKVDTSIQQVQSQESKGRVTDDPWEVAPF